ncbi:hypothetical protein ACMS1Z_04250 [Acidiphilium multivorum]|uniref:hypothetical protein n=1 Tax=Acidiphilium multivorum TaxID=62140 RepID=UPI0039C9C1EC
MWRIDPNSPLFRASDGVIIRLLDMAQSVFAIGEGPHRDQSWHSENAEHRRAVRLSIERLRSLLDRYASEAGPITYFLRIRDAAETMFGALIALDQTFIDQVGPARERLDVARAFRGALLLVWSSTLRDGGFHSRTIQRSKVRVGRLRRRLTNEVFIGCTIALEQALDILSGPDPDVSTLELPQAKADRLRARSIPAAILHQALRQAAGLEQFHIDR